jgi:hypothetical protein
MIGLMRVSPLFKFNFFELFIGTQWCMVLAIPFIALYNVSGKLKVQQKCSKSAAAGETKKTGVSTPKNMLP